MSWFRRGVSIALGSATIFITTAAFPGRASAQDLKLVGLSGRVLDVTPSQIAQLPHVQLTVSVEGQTTTYRGVPLNDLLSLVGAPSGKALKGRELRDVVLVTAKDGYAVALALADTDSLVRKDQVLLADAANGAPLPQAQGPYRLVVEGDQRGARLARMVTTIELRQLSPTP
jgi:DMSO/TMAO reductase YedYZ molybdopterin-dependent catalytic subunit